METPTKKKAIFKDYSDFYDEIYKDKDYDRETDFILRVFKRYGRKGPNLLSLGCGTCNYELLLAKSGFNITGIDISEQMLNLARKKADEQKLKSKIKVFERDVRKFVFKKKFDNAMAMFNITGYQTLSKDMEQMLHNITRCLKKGGIFIFDCWYMPAVLKDKPTDRIKKIQTKEGILIRQTKSILHLNDNVIEINFDVTKLLKDKIINETKETHLMRYWSLPELKFFLNKAGFTIIKVCNFMNLDSEISEDKRDIFVVAKKK